MILFLLGLKMVRDDFTLAFADAADEAGQDGGGYVRRHFERLIVPFAMPLLIGPGAISHGHHLRQPGQALRRDRRGRRHRRDRGHRRLHPALLPRDSHSHRLLGKIGMSIVVRLLGLILCAMAVQFLLAGIADSTVGIVRHSTAVPYDGAPPIRLPQSP